MHPAQVQVGVGYNGFDSTTISLDYAWVGWKSFKELPVDFQGGATDRVLLENYNNTSALRLGRRASLHRRCGAFAAGVAATASAAPDVTVTPLLPEQDRAYGSIGGRYPINKTFSVDGAYSHIFTPGRRGRIDERTSLVADRRSAQQRRVLAAREHLLDQPARLPSNTRPETI